MIFLDWTLHNQKSQINGNKVRQFSYYIVHSLLPHYCRVHRRICDEGHPSFSPPPPNSYFVASLHRGHSYILRTFFLCSSHSYLNVVQFAKIATTLHRNHAQTK